MLKSIARSNTFAKHFIYLNARALIERKTSSGAELVLQTRDKEHEHYQTLELPGGRVELFESLIDFKL